jgi:phenylacetic acid degradation operon negative regulatory protein
MLFTVLGEFVLPDGRATWTSTIIDILGRMGVDEKAVRQALMRTAADGWLVSERSGRRTRWHLTDNAVRLLSEGTQRIYSFTATTPTWDGRFLLVLVRVPERDRSIRHLLRSRLGWAGFGNPDPGLWISTHTDRLHEVVELLSAAEITDARVFFAEHAAGADLASMVRQAWDLDVVRLKYEAFLNEFASARSRDPLARLLELVHAWRRFPSIDPALPRELLPANWPGERAARLFAKRHATLTGPATTAWTSLNRG